MKITQEHTGKKVTRIEWNGAYVTVMYVGNVSIFVMLENGDECSYLNDDRWSVLEDPKKKIRMAPALCRYLENQHYFISQSVHENEKDAKTHWRNEFISWPANDTMWVEVEI